VSRIEAVAAALKSIVQIIVSFPKHVEISTETASDTSGREVTSFEINVHESDRGKLIGKGGVNMKALRVLMNSAAYLIGARYRVSCRDVSGQDRTAWRDDL
jgi:predicted RNA-binding protein YlqC (UPF0109 family)